jgi:hypothetical protein
LSFFLFFFCFLLCFSSPFLLLDRILPLVLVSLGLLVHSSSEASAVVVCTSLWMDESERDIDGRQVSTRVLVRIEQCVWTLAEMKVDLLPIRDVARPVFFVLADRSLRDCLTWLQRHGLLAGDV